MNDVQPGIRLVRRRAQRLSRDQAIIALFNGFRIGAVDVGFRRRNRFGSLDKWQ